MPLECLLHEESLVGGFVDLYWGPSPMLYRETDWLESWQLESRELSTADGIATPLSKRHRNSRALPITILTTAKLRLPYCPRAGRAAAS